MLTVPKEIQGLHIIASFSGGKDSTALLVALQASGLPFTAVFADTGWEHPVTYAYIDEVAAKLGIVVHKVGVAGGMVARSATRAGFPTRMAKWCTQELKLDPIRAFTVGLRATVGDTVAAVGVRADESAKRAELPELGDDSGPKGFDGYVWRPLLRWTIDDVLRAIREAGLDVNPLYRMGMDRVGCFPCIFASKAELHAMAEIWPERVDQIEALEAEFTRLRAERNAEYAATTGKALLAAGWRRKPQVTWKAVKFDGRVVMKKISEIRWHRFGKWKDCIRYNHDQATFFQSRRADMQPQGIRELIDWSYTARGGKQYDMFPGATGGCMSWGLCDLPSKKE